MLSLGPLSGYGHYKEAKAQLDSIEEYQCENPPVSTDVLMLHVAIAQVHATIALAAATASAAPQGNILADPWDEEI